MANFYANQTDYKSLYSLSYFGKASGVTSYNGEIFTRALIEFCRQRNVRHVVDVGSGSGALGVTLRQAGLGVLALDFDPIVEGGIHFDLAGPLNEALSVADTIRERTGGESWLVTCLDVLEHIDIEDVPAAVQNLRAISDGLLVASISTRPSSADNRYHATILPKPTWLEVLRTVGFEIVLERVFDEARTVRRQWPEDESLRLVSYWASADPFGDIDAGEPDYVLALAKPGEWLDPAQRSRVEDMLDLGYLKAKRSQFGVGEIPRIGLNIHHPQDYWLLKPLLEVLPRSSVVVLIRRAVLRPDEYSLIRGALARCNIEMIAYDRCAEIPWQVLALNHLLSPAESTVAPWHVLSRQLVEAAKLNGVHTIQLQHGVWIEPFDERVIDFGSETILTWGKSYEALISAMPVRLSGRAYAPRTRKEWQKFLPIGGPKFADLKFPQMDDLLLWRFGIKRQQYRSVALLGTNLLWNRHGADKLEVRSRLAEVIRTTPDVFFVVKLHPSERAVDVGELRFQNSMILDDILLGIIGVGINRLVSAVDIVISSLSTLLVDAAVAGKPSIQYDTGNSLSYHGMQPVSIEMLPQILKNSAGMRPQFVLRDTYAESADEPFYQLFASLLTTIDASALPQSALDSSALVYSTAWSVEQEQLRINDLQASLVASAAQAGRIRDELATTLEELSAERTEHAKILSRADLLQSNLERTESERDATQRDLTAVKGNLAATKQNLAAARADLEITRANLEASQQANASLQAVRIQALQIEQSTFWRATSPLRRVLGRVPEGVRQNCRRAAKALWWTITPHRMPRRVAFLRARRQQQSLQSSGGDAGRDVSGPHGLFLKSVVRRHLVYQPGDGSSRQTDMAQSVGHYALAPKSDGYVYVPGQRPHDIEAVLAGLPSRPLFSIVVPTFNTEPGLLVRLLASVTSQWYPDWELIVADDASTNPETCQFLGRISDPRIQVIFLEKNGGISAATNAGLTKAGGEYVVFLDHDDELTSDCLYELALCIARDNPDFVYSDEDKIDEQGRFVQPFFKPAWSPDALMSTMYTCHVSCVRRSLLQQVGPLRTEFDGVQDWDLILRVTEKAERIAHVPKVLYHWRIIPASVASSFAAKPQVVEAAVRAREAALERRGVRGILEPVQQVPGYHRVRYVPDGNPLVSIIIPSRDNGQVLSRCLASLDHTNAWRRFEVVVIDNGSVASETLGILEGLASAANIRVIRHDAPFNFSELNNIGVRESRGDVLLFLNDDTELLSVDGLERMIGYAQLPHIGAVGAKLLYPGGKLVQHAGVLNLASGPGHAFLRQPADSPGYFMRNLLEFDWSAVTGACLMVEREKFLAVGGFDEDFPVAYNDVDLCFRLLQRGLFNVVCPAATWIHHESLSRGQDSELPERAARLKADKRRLYFRHPDMLMRDPFHSPNLCPDNVYFEVPA
ncbi:MAG: glycosyltransferase [Burkholderiaceae bacterium]